MKNFRTYDRSQRMLLPPDLKDWVADDDLAHFIVEAAERVDMRAFHISRTGSGKAQYHPTMMLGLLVYCYASGIFSSRRIEQASYRNVSVRFIAANSHPDHDTIAKFRRDNGAAFQAAFTQILLLARELGILKVGMVSVDGTKIDANASKIKSLRYDRIMVLRSKLEADIAELVRQAEAADQADVPDGLSLPDEIARRQNLKDKLDAAAKRLEEVAHNDDGPDDGPDDDPTPPKPEQQTNLTDPDSAIMRKSSRHEYRQAYNAQAIVDADGSALILATTVLSTTNDRQDLDALVGQLCETIGKPSTLLGDAGYAGEEVVAALERRDIEPLIAIARQEVERPYDFRPPKRTTKPPPRVTAPWRIAMQQKLQTDEGKQKYRKRKSTAEPVFGIIKSVLGFTHFHLRGIENVQNEWTLVALAHNCKRLSRLLA
jgi:transposase